MSTRRPDVAARNRATVPWNKGRGIPAVDRVLARVTYDHGCWVFTGYRSRDGYGRIKVGPGRQRECHAVVYEAVEGVIPNGMQIDHRCRNPACCNPIHLDVVTSAENTRRGRTAGHTWSSARRAPKET